MIHTVKVFGIVNKAEIDVFLEFSCFFNDPADVGNLISGSSAFSKTSLNIWMFMVHVLLKPGLEIFFFFSFIFISWKLITLQYCSGFCHSLTCISNGFTCVPHHDPPTAPSPSHPTGSSSAPALSMENFKHYFTNT